METFSINGVEIFSAGTWNGDRYTVEDLNKMVQAFNETKDGVRPYLKLGHDDDQKLIQKDGLPAAGWIDRLYVIGEKLLADFTDIPKKVYELIQSKAYRKVSSEIFYNISIGEAKYQYLLGAVALLGADTPGVMNLKDILAQYALGRPEALRIYAEKAIEIKQVNFSPERKERMEKSEKEIKLEFELKAKNEAAQALEEKSKEQEKALKDKEAEIESLRQFKAKAEAEAAKQAQELENARIEKFVTELKAEKLCTPAMENLVKELLGPEKKEYSVKIQEKEEKLSKDGLFKEVLKLFKAAAQVNFDESSSTGINEGKNSFDEQDKKIREYMAQYKVTYGAAAKAIMSQQK